MSNSTESAERQAKVNFTIFDCLKNLAQKLKAIQATEPHTECFAISKAEVETIYQAAIAAQAAIRDSNAGIIKDDGLFKNCQGTFWPSTITAESYEDENGRRLVRLVNLLKGKNDSNADDMTQELIDGLMAENKSLRASNADLVEKSHNELIALFKEALLPHCESSIDWTNNCAINRCVNLTLMKIEEYKALARHSPRMGETIMGDVSTRKDEVDR